MCPERVQRIESWFREHEDSDFAVPPRACPYAVIGVTSACHAVIHTTKPGCLVPRLEQLGANLPVAMIGRYGLPSSADAQWIARLTNGAEYVLLGDADPPDLLVFAWLRAHIHIKWWGVSDTFLNVLGVPQTDRITIPLSDSERAAIPELDELCPDFRHLLGPYCASLLDRGRKIELEGALNFATVSASGWLGK